MIKNICKAAQGFTLTEMLISVAIMGVLTSIASPPLIENLHRARQSEASSLLSQLAVSAATYKDEFGEAPTTWEDLSEISAVMTANGPAIVATLHQIFQHQTVISLSTAAPVPVIILNSQQHRQEQAQQPNTTSSALTSPTVPVISDLEDATGSQGLQPSVT